MITHTALHGIKIKDPKTWTVVFSQKNKDCRNTRKGNNR